VLDWLVIGGGIHGTCISRFLTAANIADGETLRVLDPHPEPLRLWNRFGTACGMAYLRSPSVHHLDVDPYALDRFAESSWPEGAEPPFRPPKDRPAFSLFRAHCDRVIRERGLESLRIRGRALALRNGGNHIVAETDAGDFRARNAVLATGSGERPRWPRWARQLREAGAPISHVFDPDFSRERFSEPKPIAVVGGGMTGAQLAAALVAENRGPVTLIADHPLKTSPFDFDPCWLGPKCFGRRPGESADGWEARVRAARRDGTVTPDVADRLRTDLREGRLAIMDGQVRSGEFRNSETRLTGGFSPLGEVGASSGRKIERFVAEGPIILATGFDSRVIGGRFLETAMAEFDLKTTPEGRPRLNRDIRWGPGIWTTGVLAETALGPQARNIVGARHAARAIVATAESE
jgi:hypothetical protein